MLKNGVLDPQGKAIQQTLNGMGFSDVEEVKQGKYFDIEINENDEKKAKTKVKDQFNIELQLEIKLLGFDEKTMDALTGKTIV